MQVTANHGGYLGGECIMCGAIGWLDGKLGYAHDAKDVMNNRLKHKKTCPVSPHALKKMVQE